MYHFTPEAHRGALPLSTALLAETPSLSLALRGHDEERLRLAKAFIVPHPPSHRHSAPSTVSSTPSNWSESDDSSSSEEDGEDFDEQDSDDDDDDEDDSESEAGDEWEVRRGQIVLAPHTRSLGTPPAEREKLRAPPSTPRGSPVLPGLAMLRSPSERDDEEEEEGQGTPKRDPSFEGKTQAS